jgi:hypothetical protein
MIRYLPLLTLVLTSLSGCHFKHKFNDSIEHKYIISEVGSPNSLDPLDADKTINLPAARMLYLTPIENSPQDELTSTILESFSYNKDTHQIFWRVKKGLIFSNGEEIRPEDVAFSVSRMVYTRPLFPVIRHIKGVDQWLKSDTPLSSFPSGIKIKDSLITIELDTDVNHPLFRFVLELFSIIPKNCVDVKTNKLVCDEVPFSGYYEKTSKSDKKWTFKLRDQAAKMTNVRMPKNISFIYIKPDEIKNFIPQIDDNTVIQTRQDLISTDDYKYILENTNVKDLAFSRFASFVLNPNMYPFTLKECRQTFAKIVRDVYEQERQDHFQLENSLFTKIVPGYLPKDELKYNLPEKNVNECREKFKNLKISLVLEKNNNQFYKVMMKVFKSLDMNVEFIPFKNRDQATEMYLANKSFLYWGSSGFWPLDPVGDIKMFLTPNMHDGLNYVTKDSELQHLLKDLDVPQDNRKQNLEKVNQYMFDQSKINVFQHLCRFFITNKNVELNNIPLSITAPTPWQVFKQ